MKPASAVCWAKVRKPRCGSYIGCRSIPFQHLCLLLHGEYAHPFIRAVALSEGRSEDTLPEVKKSPDSPYGSVAHTSHGNGGSAHTPLHDRQRYLHYIPRRNESSARPHHRPTHHLRSGLPPHPAETSSSDLADNSNTLHVHNIYKVQAPPIHSPISNSATHPLKFFWLRISLRKTTAHPLSYACKQAKGFSRCKHLMRIYSQKEVALRSTATAVL